MSLFIHKYALHMYVNFPIQKHTKQPTSSTQKITQCHFVEETKKTKKKTQFAFKFCVVVVDFIKWPRTFKTQFLRFVHFSACSVTCVFILKSACVFVVVFHMVRHFISLHLVCLIICLKCKLRKFFMFL